MVEPGFEPRQCISKCVDQWLYYTLLPRLRQGLINTLGKSIHHHELHKNKDIYAQMASNHETLQVINKQMQENKNRI